MILSQSLKENFNLIETSYNSLWESKDFISTAQLITIFAHLFSDSFGRFLCYVVPHSEKSVHCITLKFLS